MSAYGAAISLRNTVEHIASCSRFRLEEPSVDILAAAWKELQPLQDILQKLDSTSKSRSRSKINALDRLIRDTLSDFEDLLESLVSNQFQSQLDSTSNIHETEAQLQALQSQYNDDVLPLFSIDLQSLKDDVPSFLHKLHDIMKEYIHELDNMPHDQDEDEESIPSSKMVIGGVMNEPKMIGFSDLLQGMKHVLMRQRSRNHVYTLFGMGGIGKTTLAKQIFEDPSIRSHYDCRVWVTAGRKSQSDQVARAVLAQLDPPPNGSTAVVGDDDHEKYYNLSLKERLEDKKCLIVVDDVWEIEVLHTLLSSLTDKGNGMTQILVTARGRYVMKSLRSYISDSHFNMVRFLNEKESKDLLCEKVFGEEICPPQLVKAATKIARKCEGLPLLIVTVADILSQAQSSDPEYWDDVAEMRNSVFADAYNEVSKVLFPSYDYLPQYLKMLFLFLGVFPPDYDIPISKIVNMLTAEGWFNANITSQSLNNSVFGCLEELYRFQNLIFFEERSIFRGTTNDLLCKTCRLHSAWRHLCRAEARKINFFHVLNKLVDASEDVMKYQRCLCLENNILFSIKEFCNSVKCFCASSTRSLLFVGPYHQYPTPIGVDFKLLRELDALKLRFYSFPIEILTLFHLKYLALTCNGELPTTISKLFNLRVLIIHPHSKIRFCRAPSYIPIQIWEMQQLEHIEILGKSFVAPYRIASNLDNLATLVGVNISICNIFQLFEKIPSVSKLSFQIELSPLDSHVDLLSCFRSASRLENLVILKCSIMNPPVLSPWTSHPYPLKLPHELKKLHLSGMGFPWEYMNAIGSLPELRVLKLRSYAFRGSTWETEEKSFPRLLFLLIEDSDLVEWKPSDGSFGKLSHLSIKHCYKLEKFHWPSTCMTGKIEVVDCSPSALSCAMHSPLKKDVSLTVAGSTSFSGRPETFKLERKG